MIKARYFMAPVGSNPRQLNRTKLTEVTSAVITTRETWWGTGLASYFAGAPAGPDTIAIYAIGYWFDWTPRAAAAWRRFAELLALDALAPRRKPAIAPVVHWVAVDGSVWPLESDGTPVVPTLADLQPAGALDLTPYIRDIALSSEPARETLPHGNAKTPAAGMAALQEILTAAAEPGVPNRVVVCRPGLGARIRAMLAAAGDTTIGVWESEFTPAGKVLVTDNPELAAMIRGTKHG